MSDEPEAVASAKFMLRQGMDVTDAWDAVHISRSPKERARALEIVEAMESLILSGYEPGQPPDLGIPHRHEDGSLRFLAKSGAVRQRAEAAYSSQAVEDWVFFNGEEDEQVKGQVCSTDIVHGQLMFTIKPENG